jgi:hypothetical protein
MKCFIRDCFKQAEFEYFDVAFCPEHAEGFRSYQREMRKEKEDDKK